VKEPDRSGLLDCDVRILHRLRGPRHVDDVWAQLGWRMCMHSLKCW